MFAIPWGIPYRQGTPVLLLGDAAISPNGPLKWLSTPSILAISLNVFSNATCFSVPQHDSDMQLGEELGAGSRNLLLHGLSS